MKTRFIKTKLGKFKIEYLIFFVSAFLAFCATMYYFEKGLLIAYGDAESHLNIAKRVVSSITPGLAQLGGIWLPFPHLLMTPFTFFDPLWRTGFAGSIVSGFSFVIATFTIYRLVFLVTKNKFASCIASLVFATNPNVLYMQSTAMTELPLIMFFLLSTYYFLAFLEDEGKYYLLILAAFFGFLATLSRYDGWFLVMCEVLLLAMYYFFKKKQAIFTTELTPDIKLDRYFLFIVKRTWNAMEGKIILFSVLAFFGIALWISWDFLILHDAFYFTNSPFSAKSQQQGWLARGELPTYHNLSASLLYYGDAAYRNIGFVISILSVCGALLFILEKNLRYKFYALSLFFVPFVFYVLTLYMGQSVIFIPDLTPAAFGWKLFNVRYGLMMIPAAAFFTGYLLYRLPQLLTFDWLVDKENIGRKNKFFSAMNHTILIQGGMIILLLIGLQTLLFATEAEPIMTLQDGTIGLSASRSTSAQEWLIKNYDTGLVLIDDYARTVSIIKSGIPMQEVIYIGNKPYWDESLRQPEKYAKWIVMQKGDSVWSALMDNPRMQGDLYKYFEKAYTSPEILVFKRSQTKALSYNH